MVTLMSSVDTIQSALSYVSLDDINQCINSVVSPLELITHRLIVASYLTFVDLRQCQKGGDPFGVARYLFSIPRELIISFGLPLFCPRLLRDDFIEQVPHTDVFFFRHREVSFRRPFDVRCFSKSSGN